VGRAFDCRDPQGRARAGDPGGTRAVRAYADRVAEILGKGDMSRIQFIESARSADTRPTLDLRSQLAYLRDEWRLMFRPGTMAADALAGIAVALVALPLSLAIATASRKKTCVKEHRCQFFFSERTPVSVLFSPLMIGVSSFFAEKRTDTNHVPIM